MQDIARLENPRGERYALEGGSRILHLDVTLTGQDFFRVSLAASRKRITVAACAAAVVITGSVWLFLSVGEPGMLLQLSPLFIGFPLVCLAGQILRLRAACGRYYAHLSEARRNPHFIFQDASDGFDVITGQDFRHISWGGVHELVEKPRYFLIYLNPVEAFFIPKGGLVEEEERVLRAILSSRLGSRAKLSGARAGG
jgi:hypothetical protein